MKYNFLIVLCLLLVGCSKKSAQQSAFDPSIPVCVQVISSYGSENSRAYVGMVDSEVSIALSFPFGGELTGIYVQNGQRVKKGALLATVDDTSAKSLHDAALATLRQAEDGYARLQRVHEQGGVSEVRWVQMETDLEKARSAEASARKHLNDCSLYAPQDGIISMVDHTLGETVAPGVAFARLLDLDKMLVTFTVPEKEIALVSKGDRGIVVFPAMGPAEHSIRVSNKSLLANPLGHTYRVNARILDGKDNLLPGMVAKIRLHSTATDGIVIPSSCVLTMADGPAVWAVEDGQAHRRHIVVNEYVKNGVLVESGLHAGDTIVTEGYQKLYNGAPVSISDL